jgi:hypothetical protein
MERLKKLLKNKQIGIDAWYDSYLEDATRLMRELVDAGQTNACLGLLKELTNDEQVRFFEAFTNIQDLSLVPQLFEILGNSTMDIAEPIIDGLRGWELSEDERRQLHGYAEPFYGRSPVLDKIIDSIV